MVVYLGAVVAVIIYVILLLRRLVRAVERIAGKI